MSQKSESDGFSKLNPGHELNRVKLSPRGINGSANLFMQAEEYRGVENAVNRSPI